MKKQIIALAVFAVAVSASALTLKEKKQFADWQTYLKSADQSYVKTVKDKCGIDIPVTLEEKFTTPFMEKNANAASYCDAPRSTLASMCDDATSKTEIVKKVKKITCKLGKPDEATFKLSGTELVFTVGVSASNLDEKAKEFFEKNL